MPTTIPKGAVTKSKKLHSEKPVRQSKTHSARKEHGVEIKTIFFPTDFSAHSVSLLPVIIDLCTRLEARLVMFHAYKVAVADEYMPANMVDSMITEGEKATLKKLKSLNTGDTVVPISYSVKMGFTAESIADAAAEAGADLIIMGTNGCDSLEDRIFGTVSWNTIKHTEIPVLTLPEGVKELTFNEIIFPFECTDKDINIIHFALQIAHMFDSRVHLIHFLLEGAVINKTILDKINARFHKEIREEKLEIQILADKNITDGITRYAERIGADTIFMVTHSRGLLATLFHMSTTRKIALYNNIPLFAFKSD